MGEATSWNLGLFKCKTLFRKMYVLIIMWLNIDTIIITICSHIFPSINHPRFCLAWFMYETSFLGNFLKGKHIIALSYKLLWVLLQTIFFKVELYLLWQLCRGWRMDSWIQYPSASRRIVLCPLLCNLPNGSETWQWAESVFFPKTWYYLSSLA